MKAPLWRTTCCIVGRRRGRAARRHRHRRDQPAARASRWSPRSTRCAATRSPPRAARPASIAADDSLDEHAYDTVSGSDWLGDQDAVEAFVRGGPARAAAARALGLPVEPAARRPRSPYARSAA